MATQIVFLSLENDPVNTLNLELGFSDGTPGGATILDLFPGLDGSNHFNFSAPHFFTQFGNRIIFQASDGTSGRELWITDGTAGGTQLLKDINAVAPTATHDGFFPFSNFIAQSQIDSAKPVVIGNTAYFVASDGTHGFELWKTDGTPGGTELVKDINTTGADSSNPSWMVAVDNTLYFVADDGTNHRQIWKSDGTPGNTIPVTALTAGAGGDPNSAQPFSLTVSGNLIYFVFNDGTVDIDAQQVYVTDGSVGGEHLLDPAEPAILDPRNFADINGTLYFCQNDGQHGFELWKSDGTPAGTVMVKDINASGPLGPGAPSSVPFGFTAFNGEVYFVADDGTHGFELWKTNGTEAGTQMVTDINTTVLGPGTEGAIFSPFSFVTFNNELYFAATDGIGAGGHGIELWKTNGTAAGTVLVADLFAGTTSGTPTEFQVIDGILYFGANAVGGGFGQLFRYDGVNPPQIISSNYHFGGGVEPFSFISGAVNDPPVNTVPGTQDVEANTATAIAGLSIADPDADPAAVTTTLSVLHGTLTVASAGGATVGGSGTNTVTLTGPVAAINTTLSAAGNIVYKGGHDFFGTDTLTVLTDDGGNTGIGGALTDTDNVTINLNTLLNGTPGNDSFDALPGQEMINGLGGIDTITFNFKLVDANVTYESNKVIIDGPSGSHTVLTGFEVFNFTDGTVHNDDATRLIDDLFYYSHNHDVWNAHADADAHFLLFGRHEGRDPNFFFSTVVYGSANPDVAASGSNPLDHFDGLGWLEGRVPSIHFDPAQYLAANPDVAAAGVNPLRHYLQFGYEEGRLPFAPTELVAQNGFDYVHYLNNNPDVAASGVDPFQHFMTVGWQEGRNPNALFDVNGYLANYADVAASGVNPLTHYDQFGWHEGRDPSPGFDTTSYLAAYADVTAAGVNPLTHFLHYGIHEGRSPFADGVWG